jgi:hypothetical protein
MRPDILDFDFIDPGTVQATSRMTLIQRTTSHWFGLQHPGIESVLHPSSSVLFN